MLNAIAERITAEAPTPSARSIAAVIGRMITSGELPADTRMPTVRQLSRRLGVSPTTVSEAWRGLAATGAIETRGRNGTYVRTPAGRAGPRRYRQITHGPGHSTIDLSTGTPDPALLPELGPLIARVGAQSTTSSYLDSPVLPELDAHLRAHWPYTPEAMTVVNGAMDAIDRIAQVILRIGDRVIVEHPTFPPLLDLLDLLGCEVIGVDVDECGLEPAGLARALQLRPAALFLQPRAHNPTGIAMTPERAAALADVIVSDPGAAKLTIVEDDHANEISAAQLVSLGHWLPERTVHVRSYAKSHGPDLRLAAVGGAGDVVDTMANRRLLGPGWSSRVLQAVLLEMLDDDATATSLATARQVYESRRKVISAILDEAGIDHPTGDGINLWMRVTDERSALVRLAGQGIGVAPGTPFLTRPDADHLRVTVGRIPDDQLDWVGTRLADAARVELSRRAGMR